MPIRESFHSLSRLLRLELPKSNLMLLVIILSVRLLDLLRSSSLSLIIRSIFLSSNNDSILMSRLDFQMKKLRGDCSRMVLTGSVKERERIGASCSLRNISNLSLYFCGLELFYAS